MNKIKNSLKSVRVKLFLTLCIVVIAIITFLIIVNNVILESFYLYTKKDTLKTVYEQINESYLKSISQIEIEQKIKEIAINNNFDILIESGDNVSVYSTDKDFFSTLNQMGEVVNQLSWRDSNVLERTDNYVISKIEDGTSSINYLFLSARLDNGYMLYIRMPITIIEESVRTSNKLLYLIAGFAIILAGIMVSFVSKRFTKPILELNGIAKKMSNLDFSDKYDVKDVDDEINDLGKSINTMSDKLEATIKQLRSTNIELEKDIEEKSKIDEMRKSFISDVSHELKTPIALIQGYSEGLLENINKDEESRKFYAEVILDETNKMDKLVKQLLELMKLEYGNRKFNNTVFDIVEMEEEVIRKSKVMLDENNIKIEFCEDTQINVYADEFYMEQVMTNYLTNAIKYSKEINKEKIIKIENKIDKKEGIVRVSVFNTGDNISDEEISRIWNRFYKSDSARTRSGDSTGIGLSIVKAIMNNYGHKFGVRNKLGGVEFYFDLELKQEDKEEGSNG